MNKTERGAKSGEIITMALIGLAVGAIVSVVAGNKWMQDTANATGQEVGVGQFMADEPIQAFGYPIAGALLGAGIGALTESSDDDKPDTPKLPDVVVQSGRDSVVVITGRDGTASNDQSQPVTTLPPPAPAPAVAP